MWMFPINDNNMVTRIRHEIIMHTYLGYYMHDAFVIMLQKQRCISFCIRAHQNKGLLCNCYNIFCKQLVASQLRNDLLSRNSLFQMLLT